MKKPNLLVIEAHSDDSAIGAYGLLERHRNSHNLHFLVASISDIKLHHIGFVSRDARMAEYQSFVDHFGGFWQRSNQFPLDKDSRFDTIPLEI